MKAQSVYYVLTRKALREGEYLSPIQMKAEMEDLPFYDEDHAHEEILKAVQDHNQ